MTNRNAVIGDYFERFVSEQVATGRFNNSSEVLRAGLRLLEEHELHLREQKSVVRLKEADAKIGLDVSSKDAAQVTRSVSDAMRAIASAGAEKAEVLPAIPATKGVLRPQIAAE